MRIGGWMGLVALGAVPAMAQTDMAAMQHSMLNNQLGVMEYCKAQGHADDSGVAAERASVAALPPGGTAADDATAEAKGKEGMIAGNGQFYSIADMAQKGNTTAPALCKQMADNAVRMQAMRASMPAMPAMPAMPPH